MRMAGQSTRFHNKIGPKSYSNNSLSWLLNGSIRPAHVTLAFRNCSGCQSFTDASSTKARSAVYGQNAFVCKQLTTPSLSVGTVYVPYHAELRYLEIYIPVLHTLHIAHFESHHPISLFLVNNGGGLDRPHRPRRRLRALVALVAAHSAAP